MNFKTILLVLIPTLLAPPLYLSMILLNTIFPFSLDIIKLVCYAGLPIIAIIFLILIIWKFKIAFDLKMILFSFVIGIAYTISAFLIVQYFFAPPTLVPLEKPNLFYIMVSNDTHDASSIVRNSMFISLSYLSFLVGLFVSQMIKNRILKIATFLAVGIGVCLIISIPLSLLLSFFFF